MDDLGGRWMSKGIDEWMDDVKDWMSGAMTGWMSRCNE